MLVNSFTHIKIGVRKISQNLRTKPGVRTFVNSMPGQGRCASCLKKWGLSSSDLCACGDVEMMSHIVESCPHNKLDGGIHRLHSADDTAVRWLNAHHV